MDAIDALYAPGARFHSQPFRDPQYPREYAAWAFAEQASAECRFGRPIAAETLAGTSLLYFDDEGLVVEQRDAWNSEPGRVELPGWASRLDDAGSNQHRGALPALVPARHEATLAAR